MAADPDIGLPPASKLDEMMDTLERVTGELSDVLAAIKTQVLKKKDG